MGLEGQKGCRKPNGMGLHMKYRPQEGTPVHCSRSLFSCRKDGLLGSVLSARNAPCQSEDLVLDKVERKLP